MFTCLLGLRCLKRYGRRIGRYLLGDKACNGDISSAIGDHGRFYHLAGERHASLFIGQPYGNGTITPGMENDLAIARDLGLHIHVGALGEAWYNDSVAPIIISQHPIPDHKYIYRGEYV